MGIALIPVLVSVPIIIYLIYKNKELQRDCEQLREDSLNVEQREKAKSNFLATMSHEIRTPLNGVIVASKLLRESTLSSEQEELVDIVNNSGDLLIGVVNDILDFSKIESGKLELDYAPFDIRTLLKDVTFSFKKQFEDKDIYLKYKIDNETPFYFYSDEIRLKQIFFNIVGNAYKFTECGGVSINLNYDTELGQLSIVIADTGIGIAEDKIDSLFEQYQQESKSTFKNFGGTGLGLSITKSLTELLSGKISVTSKQGQGTTFSIVVPMEMSHPPAIEDEKEESHDFASLSVLVVDDNAINRKVAMMSFKKYGVVPDQAQDGVEAVKFATDKVYDIIYMDIHMPNMTGLEASEKLIEEIPISKLPVIYALSANAFKENKDACFNAGMSGFISKPITLEKLDESLLVALKKKKRREKKKKSA